MLENVSAKELAGLLRNDLTEPCWPGLLRVAVKERAREYTRRSGLWNQLVTDLKAQEPIPVLRYSDYCDYQRTGSRSRYETLMRQRVTQTHLAALALWLDHPAANLDYLQDLLWAWCEAEWNLPAHHGLHIELMSSSVGVMLAEYGWLFRDRLDMPVQNRLNQELERRLLQVAFDWRKPDWWNTAENNWNTVCNSNLIQLGMYQIGDPQQLAAFIHPLIRRMEYAIAYFPEDGGCPEGAGYWEYGFGHFLDAALVVWHRTGGKINLADHDHIRQICRFPLAVQLQGAQRANFSDSGNGYVSAENALKAKKMCGVSELLQAVNSSSTGELVLTQMRGLALYEGERPAAVKDQRDYLLPQLGFAKVHAGANVILSALAGNNDVSHNHNDIGSFTLMVGGKELLTDPGAPIYTARTFSPHRYEIFVCRSRGHSVPLINGLEQVAGPQYYGTIAVEGLNIYGNKVVRLDLSHAYPDPSLDKYMREFVCQSRGEIHLRDSFQFRETPRSLEEAFITYANAAVSEDKQSISVGDKDAMLKLQANAAGEFALEEIPAAVHEGRDQRPLRRIVFVPQNLARTMQLEFTLSPQVGS